MKTNACIIKINFNVFKKIKFMKTRNLRFIGIATAVVTVVTLNLILGGSRWAYGSRYGHWRNHCLSDDYRNNEVDRIPPGQTK
jgi:hypothetical protein